MGKDNLKLRFESILSDHRIAGFVKEHQFAKSIGRRWRFDYAFVVEKVAVELEGGIWVRGSHTRPIRYISDCDKYNRAALMGWMVLRYTTEHISKRPQQIADEILEAINEKRKEA